MSMSKTVQRYYLQSLAKELLGLDHRINVCMSCLSPLASAVDVMRVEGTNRAYYSGLMVCGSVWVCPVCAARITEERRRELTIALTNSRYTPLLATFTIQHSKRDLLKPMLETMIDSYRAMKSGKAWQELKTEYDMIGGIKSLEVTHGDNGWHPHQHELMLLDRTMPKSHINGLLSDLKTKWHTVLSRNGLDASWERGVTLKAADIDVKEYIAKFGHEPVITGWTIEHELTKQPVKKAKKGGKSPLQLLADYGEGNIKSGRLWKAYAYAFAGRNQLVYSRGLRSLLGLSDKEPTEEEIAQSVPTDAVVLARLLPHEWKAIKKADIRGELLDAAVTMTDVEFRRWLNTKLENWL